MVPQAERRKPSRSIDAKFSLPFTLGLAAAGSKIVLGDFLAPGLDNRTALEMAGKVTLRVDQEFTEKGISGGAVKVTTHDGKSFLEKVNFAYGPP